MQRHASEACQLSAELAAREDVPGLEVGETSVDQPEKGSGVAPTGRKVVVHEQLHVSEDEQRPRARQSMQGRAIDTTAEARAIGARGEIASDSGRGDDRAASWKRTPGERADISDLRAPRRLYIWAH